jgi:hypothetical protein
MLDYDELLLFIDNILILLDSFNLYIAINGKLEE